ncbi:arabinogalactan endo-1,4-beta-galactosidase [Periconia macrospinosa]|uniref:ferroxidase n=1 Tax=Periconia macrospinosa TaxID=97972 RepID=A0A2V1E5V5_9PLEO|nr:arabinogalactan endo-1,4-beta-galactosidase [Periconia macrospinosa]
MKSVSRAGQNALRQALRSPIRAHTSFNGVIFRAAVAQGRNTYAFNNSRNFHASIRVQGIMPESENPPPRNAENVDRPTVPTDIPTSEFHQRADVTLDDLVARLEEKQESTPDLEVEYSSGVLEIKIPSKEYTYVLNKQPPNKQIWLSSPLSGPKRFDWVVSGESMHQKEGGGSGDWVYLRDGTTLSEIVHTELGVELGKDNDVPS